MVYLTAAATSAERRVLLVGLKLTTPRWRTCARGAAKLQEIRREER